MIFILEALPAGSVGVPTAYIAKYNKYIDSIFSRVNKVLKRNYDPVNVRLQTAPENKKKPTGSKTSTKQKRKPVAARPSSRIDGSVTYNADSAS